ncbi:hypothetical protein [Methylophaga thiooxydans]|uniref:hypothetical protein n=1 Tax=Methylophaga thiooxydans TaxID=392484 RepID=UPI0023537427|nr:hypothetical protein [Methylophaga thiooxydans]
MSGFVSVEVEGKLYESEYHEVGGVVRVYGDLGDPHKPDVEFTTLGGMKPDQVARILLRRLVKRGVVSAADD